MNNELKKMIDDFFCNITKEELIGILTESGMGTIEESPKELNEIILDDYVTNNLYYDLIQKSNYDSTRLYDEAA